jgi:nitrite reductase/ring-hydroxylating ferredoxin subunit
MNIFFNDKPLEKKVELVFNGTFWKYEPVIEILLDQKIPVLNRENPHLFKSLTISLPFLEKQYKTAFIYLYEEEVKGFFNLCSHIKVPLDLDDHRFFNVLGNIVCKVHGAQFCPKTGNVISGPARSPLYRLKLRYEEEKNLLFIEGFYRPNLIEPFK